MGHNELLFVLSLLLILTGIGLLCFVCRTARKLDSELEHQRVLTKELRAKIDGMKGRSNA